MVCHQLILFKKESGIISLTIFVKIEEIGMTINEETPQEDFEQKISEAELKAQEGDTVEEETSSSFEAVPEVEQEESLPEKKGLSRGRKLWRRVLIWLVVIAVAFAAGFFLDAQLRLEPARAEIDSRGTEIDSLEGDIDSLGDEIDSLEAEIERLGALEEKNIELSSEIDQLNIHLVLLSARVGVSDASLAIEQGRMVDAKLALNKLGSTLDFLKSLLNADQAAVVENMIQRYQLVMLELENEGATVQTDLELLTTRLQTLENTLFATP
jgi:flagellin-specific chaperone FliS